MIIASILPENDQELIRLQKEASLPEYLEVRMDHRHGEEFFHILKALPCKKIAACRRREDGGYFQGHEKERKTILEKSILSGLFEFVDVELGSEAASLIQNYPDQKFILSYHNLKETPEKLSQIYRSLISTPGVPFYKLITWAHTLKDNMRIKELLKKASLEGLPLISFCMGRRGILSRVLSLSWGSQAVYGSLWKKKKTAPGQIYYREMEEWYAVRRIRSSTQIFGVIGNPLAHTLSPAIHNAAYRDKGLDYVCIPMEIDSLEEVFKDLKEINLAGLAVTSPFKKDVMGYLDELDENAKNIEAVNTVIRKEERLVGYDTDYEAFLCEFKRCVRLRYERMAILGDGGAASAVCYALHKEGADFQIFSRNSERGRALARKFQTIWHPLGELKNFRYDIIINGTTVGMFPDLQNSPVKEEWIKGKLVFDLIYNPPVTPLMNMALNKGIQAIGGKGMFLKQASSQFKLLTGKDASLKVMDQAFQRSLLFLDKDEAG